MVIPVVRLALGGKFFSPLYSQPIASIPVTYSSIQVVEVFLCER
jgi:hypothetical protein